MQSTTTATPRDLGPATSLRQDAGVIGLVGLAHMISHFSQLLLAPLFPWLKEEFGASYAELGFLMTVFFAVSCAVQMLAGFVVDRFGPRPILFGGLATLGLAAFGFSASTSYWMLAGVSVLAGIGNGVFHPVDYTLLNRKVSGPRLGHAYSVHGITGSLGWALAPVMLVPIAIAFSWRTALVSAGTLAFAVLAVLWFHREKLSLPAAA
ncbi:MAG: transporter, partial [Rhodoferax sp.]|nr:transporter [Rhodoferax sp.]